jgi:hypothetical protein
MNVLLLSILATHLLLASTPLEVTIALHANQVSLDLLAWMSMNVEP